MTGVGDTGILDSSRGGEKGRLDHGYLAHGYLAHG